MSAIDTLDIQLTELGFPDVLQPEEPAVQPKPSEDSSSPSPLNGTTPAEASESEVNDPVEEKPRLDGDGPPAVGDGPPGDEDADNDSDDSEVSEAYEEEELDDEEEDEEELSNDPSHAGDYSCSICDLQLPSKFKLQDHMNLHTGMRPYCCAECGKRFCQIYNYRVHLRTHAKSKVERHWCRICLIGFGSQDCLKFHLEKIHLEDVFYECDLCKRVFTSLEACQNHVQMHKCMVNIICETCGRNFPSEKALVRHRKTRCNLSFKCTDCSKIFTTKNALLKHSFSHLGLLPYTCIRCRCHFRLANLYRRHKCEPQRIHCVACLREFLSQEDFQRHKKDTGCWGNQGPNQKTDEIRCLECGQRFDTSEDLKKHAGAHQRVLKCAECGKGFRSALLLMSHMGGHAGKSPCLCQSCGLGFPHQQNYDSHLKTCGQTPPSASVPKKRQTLKSSQPEKNRKDRSLEPDTLNAADTAAVADVVNKPAAPAPARDSSSPGPVTEGVPAASGPSERMWSLTLNENPPPGANLVLFLPVCPSQKNEPPLSSVNPQTPPVAPGNTVPRASPSPVPSTGFLGANSALGVALTPPLELLTGSKENMSAPLDLSKKCSSSESAVTSTPCPPIKREPEEIEVSGQGYVTEAQEIKRFDGSKVIIKTDSRERDTYSQSKRLKMHPTILSLLNTKTASPGLTVDVKKEPQYPGPDVLSSRSSPLIDRGPGDTIKTEADISSSCASACVDMEK